MGLVYAQDRKFGGRRDMSIQAGLKGAGKLFAESVILKGLRKE